MSARFDARDRNHGIDALRGFAVLLVILLHVNIRIPINRSALGAVLPRRVVWSFFTMGYEAVFVFFVVSGFLVCRTVLYRHGDLAALDVRSFYLRRAGRILPPLALLVGILSILSRSGFVPFRISPPATLSGAALSAFTLCTNAYLSFVGPLPPNWDVLWSLSIEETFYLGFPAVCLLMRRSRRGAVLVLVLLALALPLLHPDPAATNETWAEKATGPGLSAIALGIVAALATELAPVRRAAIPLRLLGLATLAAALGWEDVLIRLLGVGGDLLALAAGTAALLVSLAVRPIPPGRLKPLFWLAPIGRRSYEIYLTHMFVVLAAVDLFRRTGSVGRLGHLWYPPIVLCAVVLGNLVAHLLSDPLDRAVRRTFGRAPPSRPPVPTDAGGGLAA